MVDHSAAVEPVSHRKGHTTYPTGWRLALNPVLRASPERNAVWEVDAGPDFEREGCCRPLFPRQELSARLTVGHVYARTGTCRFLRLRA